TVLSKRGRSCIGRRWTAHNIGEGWMCEILNSKQVEAFFSTYDDDGLRKAHSGTIVVWEELEHLQTTADSIEATIHRTIRELTCELGLRFHRFIDSRKLAIFVEVQLANEQSASVSSPVEPLNPFSYPHSGRDGYPKTFNIQVGGGL